MMAASRGLVLLDISLSLGEEKMFLDAVLNRLSYGRQCALEIGGCSSMLVVIGALIVQVTQRRGHPSMMAIMGEGTHR